MFDDSINLLPEDKRDLEKREHSKAALPQVKSVEYTKPLVVKSDKSVSPVTVKKVTWRDKIFHKMSDWFKLFSHRGTADQLINQPLKKVVSDSQPQKPALAFSQVENKINQSSSVEVKKPPLFDKEEKIQSDIKNETKDQVNQTTSKKSDLPEVNLIPSEEQSGPIARAKMLLTVVVVLSALVVLLSSGGLFYYRNNLKNKSEIEQAKLISLQNNLEILRGQAEESLFFQTKIQAIQALLNKRGGWAPLFAWLEKNTVSDVYFTGFAGDSGGRITLAGLAPNYTQIAKQFKIFAEDKNVTQVEVTNLRIQKVDEEVTNVSFSFIVVAPDLFSPLAVNPK